MNQQINLRLPQRLLKSATRHANKHGFGSVQEFIKETLRDKLFPPEELSKDEMAYVMAVLKDAKENNDFISEKELFNELDQKIGIRNNTPKKISKRIRSTK
jgi:hypothetical protein